MRIEGKRNGIAFTLITWSQYSCAIRSAHILHRGRGLAGLETSAHLISMRLINIRFSGNDSRERFDTESGLFLPPLCKQTEEAGLSGQSFRGRDMIEPGAEI